MEAKRAPKLSKDFIRREHGHLPLREVVDAPGCSESPVSKLSTLKLGLIPPKSHCTKGGKALICSGSIEECNSARLDALEFSATSFLRQFKEVSVAQERIMHRRCVGWSKVYFASLHTKGSGDYELFGRADTRGASTAGVQRRGGLSAVAVVLT